MTNGSHGIESYGFIGDPKRHRPPCRRTPPSWYRSVRSRQLLADVGLDGVDYLNRFCPVSDTKTVPGRRVCPPQPTLLPARRRSTVCGQDDPSRTGRIDSSRLENLGWFKPKERSSKPELTAASPSIRSNLSIAPGSCVGKWFGQRGIPESEGPGGWRHREAWENHEPPTRSMGCRDRCRQDILNN